MPNVLDDSLIQAPEAPAAVKPPQLRSFIDPKTTRTRVYDSVLAAAQNLTDMTNQRHSLRLRDVHYADPEVFPLAQQKQAILTGKSLSRRLRGTWDLIDNATGKPIESKLATVAAVPFLTDRGTIIHNGNEYSMANQQRLLPGAYTRVKNNGEIETHINPAQGTGLAHRYYLDPAKSTFYMRVRQAKIPLMPLLRALGATDKQLYDAWGDKLLGANYQADSPVALKKMHAQFVKETDPDAADIPKSTVRALMGMQLDPDVMTRTLGKPYKNLDLDVLLDITKKLIGVSKGEQEVDDRDALANQKVMGIEDLLSERLTKDSGRLRRQLLFKASMQGSLKPVLPGALTKQIDAALLGSGLGQCFDAETSVLTRRGWVLWSQIIDSDEFACRVDGQLEYHKAIKIIRQRYSGTMYGCRTKVFSYLVTPNHRLWCKLKNTPYMGRPVTEVHGRRAHFEVHLPPAELSPSATYTLPGATNIRHGHRLPDITVPMKPWLQFLGWWLAEGSAAPLYTRSGNKHWVAVAQSHTANPEKCEKIAEVLRQLPFTWRYNPGCNAFVIRSKTLCEELQRYGLAKQKRIPRYVFDQSLEDLRGLVEAYMLGDGNNYSGYLKCETTAPRLADDLLEMFCRVGYVGRKSLRRMSAKNPNWADSWVVSLGRGKHAIASADIDNKRSGRPVSYYKRRYHGMVYCAEVPGHLLFVMRDGKPHWSHNSLEEVNAAEILDKQSRITRLGEGGIPADAVPDEARSVSPSHLGVIDSVRTPESSRAGIDLYIGAHTQKGDDGRLYVPVIDAKTGETVYRSPQDLADLTIAFPGEMSRDAKRIATMEQGRIRWRTRDKVDVILPHFEKGFSPLANLVPLKSAAKAQRMSMASRMLTQAMPLEEPEAPLVQNGVPDMADRSYEQEYGKHMGAVYSDEGGRVLKVTPDSIVMKTPTGETREIELYNNFPFNRKSSIHNTPLVQAGDFVKPGQLLARSNYTDDQGTTALGKNLHVAYMPYMGKNYEDAIVISQAAAKKLSSVHMYQHGLEFDAKTKTGKANYVGMFPSKYDKKVLQTLDNDGVIQPGRIVQYGDPLILAAGEREVTQSKVHKRGMPAFADNTVTWQHHTPGEVVDVVKGNKGINLSVKTVVPMEVGDKLSGRYGDKGVIADIIPDENMPTDSEGKPFEVLLSDLGITTRSNPSQSVEAALGLIAKRTGKPYKPVDFPDDPDADWIEKYAEAELQKHGLKSTDSVWVPELNRKVPNVQRGYRFFMKLQHMSADKGQARGTAAYTMTDEPAKGGETGSKRVSLLNLSALLGHGSTGVLKDAGSVRGQRNDDYWMAFMQGHTPPKVKVPMVYTKFVNELKAAGINVVPDGEKLHIMAMTDKDIDTLAGDREVEHGDTVRWDKGLEPVHGGLFDPTLTGGHGGRKWTKITLAEPMPNPVMEEPIRRVLGLTEKKFLGVLSGQEEMPGGGTGPQAIHKALDAINLDRELAEARAAIASGKKTARDMAVRKLGYLKSAQRLDIHPRDWMLTKAPVLPPAFRPLALMSGNNLPLVSDANYLYKELLDANSNLKSMGKLSDDVGNERLALYQSFKAVTGLADPVHPKLVEKGVGGILKSLFGSSPKHSTLQRKLISSTTDLVGRAVIVPNPELDIDSVGLPEDRAWALYQNFIVRRLSRRGLPMAEALRHAKDRTPLAKEQLLAEMGERPVFIDRAPVLHKFGIMAFWPRLTKGSTLQINPTLVGGFGADFDGDAMQYHVPVEDDARREAIERMMPSRNLMSPADFKSPMPVLRQEYLGGLHTATGRKSKRAATLFRKLEDAIAAYRAGEININDEVEIADK